MFENIMEASLLYDFYGKLLSSRQAEAMKLYHEENLSLGEIAEEFGISRQAVYDALKNGEKTLKSYEKKLGLMESFQKKEKIIGQVKLKLKSLVEKQGDQIYTEIEDIENLLKEIEF